MILAWSRLILYHGLRGLLLGCRHPADPDIAAIQTFGDRINLHPHLHFLVTEGGVDEEGVFNRVTSHIPDKGQVMVRYYGLYANAHIYRSSEAWVCGR